MTNQKKRTITLTNRAPVSIVEADWPVLAYALNDSYEGGGSWDQDNAQGELDKYYLTARQHSDGRTLVYGVFIARTFSHSPQPDHRAGVLLDAPDGHAVAEALREVGAECGLPDSVIRDAIRDLPAEEI